MDTTHLDAIIIRLSHERYRVSTAKTPSERAYREHNVRMIEREMESELRFLDQHGVIIENGGNMTDDEILAALEG